MTPALNVEPNILAGKKLMHTGWSSTELLIYPLFNALDTEEAANELAGRPINRQCNREIFNFFKRLELPDANCRVAAVQWLGFNKSRMYS